MLSPTYQDAFQACVGKFGRWKLEEHWAETRREPGDPAAWCILRSTDAAIQDINPIRVPSAPAPVTLNARCRIPLTGASTVPGGYAGACGTVTASRGSAPLRLSTPDAGGAVQKPGMLHDLAHPVRCDLTAGLRYRHMAHEGGCCHLSIGLAVPERGRQSPCTAVDRLGRQSTRRTNSGLRKATSLP